jgi:hypothetical protein
MQKDWADALGDNDIPMHGHEGGYDDQTDCRGQHKQAYREFLGQGTPRVSLTVAMAEDHRQSHRQ